MNHTQIQTSDPKPYLLWNDSWGSMLIFAGPIIALVSSTGCLTILNTHLKSLHEIFKTLMNIILVHNILMYSITIGINSYIRINHHQTFIFCSLRLITNAMPTNLTLFGIAFMSFLRYDIATKIKNCESIAKTKCLVISFMIWSMILELFSSGPAMFFGTIIFENASSAAACAGTFLEGKASLATLAFLKLSIILGIGIVYDRKMISFLHKQNNKNGPGQAKLVPWKSGGQSYNFLVPVSATITSMVTGIVGFVLSVMAVKGFGNSREESWKYLSFCTNMVCCLQMPIMIALTLRAANHKKPAPVIPKGPMFHESSEDNDEMEMQENIQENEEPIVNVENDPSAESIEEAAAAPVSSIIIVKPSINIEESQT